MSESALLADARRHHVQRKSFLSPRCEQRAALESRPAGRGAAALSRRPGVRVFVPAFGLAARRRIRGRETRPRGSCYLREAHAGHRA